MSTDPWPILIIFGSSSVAVGGIVWQLSAQFSKISMKLEDRSREHEHNDQVAHNAIQEQITLLRIEVAKLQKCLTAVQK